MKFKKLIQIAIPLTLLPIASVTTVACSRIYDVGVELIDANGNDVHFDNIEEALQHTASGDTIKLNCDISPLKTISFDNLQDVTIDGDGHSIIANNTIGNEEYKIFDVKPGSKINFKNLNIGCIGVVAVGIYVEDASIQLDNVHINGSFPQTVVLAGTSGATINNCSFVSTYGNINTITTLWMTNQSTGVVLSNTICDSIFIDNEYVTDNTSKILTVNDGCNLRYIRLLVEWTKDKFSQAVKISSTVKTFLFAGCLDWDGYYGAYYKAIDNEDNIDSIYVYDADGLYQFNVDFADGSTLCEFTKPSVHLHLMDNINYNNREWAPIKNGNMYGPVKTQHFITLFDGHGFTISNLQITTNSIDENDYCVGFFSQVGDKDVGDITTRNVTFDKCRLEIPGNTMGNAGMVYGMVLGSNVRLENVVVSNSYIGAKQKVGSLVGVIGTPDEALSPTPKLTISACTSYECTVVNKCIDDGEGGNVDVYLGGLIGWFIYTKGEGTLYSALAIDDDPTKTTYLKNIHFNWQQDSEIWDANFEIANLFLYDRAPYRHCDQFTNVVVEYGGE